MFILLIASSEFIEFTQHFELIVVAVFFHLPVVSFGYLPEFIIALRAITKIIKIIILIDEKISAERDLLKHRYYCV